ncbi:MAG: tetratricopeptide repeat protein, partial [Desulfobulbaceae bacterium]|nr:tetratricopeptide repeat protein [Desulfobulbaceae bacterium]
MKKATLLLMLIALVLGGCTTSPHVSQDMFLVNQGFEELSNSNYLEAEAYLRAALDVNPNNPYTLLNLGVVYQDTGRTKEAVQMYQKVLELNPEEIAVESNREGYSGKKIVEIARENLKSLGILIAEKGPTMSTMGLGESVVTDSEVNTEVIQYEVQLQIASYSAAGHASALYTEGNQDTVDIASGGPSGIGASAEGPGGEAASGAGSTGTGSGGTGSGGGASDGGSSGGGSADG